ncbi:NAD(P)-binding protein [Lentithecium fluviatile CBS 122367]|uniref:NAD(P)-binding protein n=1 Tax=Lentithecium fluviatile CBS 122367 TaxID=1168545 RepID=A0A6G1IPN5_9PLEO|nr:NAD(P)-binding protein [Lentithecium fluviatile CBS 122367]
MPQRTPDVVLADQFTPTTHSHPPAALNPANNKLPSPLNILIVGAARGIGAGIAYAYAHAGAATLILTARASSLDKLAEVEAKVKQIDGRITVRGALAENVTKQVNRIDIVILNSGYSGPVVTKMTSGSPRDFQDVFDVNVQGTYLIAHYLIPLLIESEGAKTFLVVSSFASCIVRGHIANTAYCVSKFAQARLVEFLSEQFGRDEDGGLVCVGVHPGAVLTEMADATTPDSFRKYLTDDVGLCGAFLIWLCRERRTWLNGRLLSANWDIDELMERRESVKAGDLLKFGFRLGSATTSEQEIE